MAPKEYTHAIGGGASSCDVVGVVEDDGTTAIVVVDGADADIFSIVLGRGSSRSSIMFGVCKT